MNKHTVSFSHTECQTDGDIRLVDGPLHMPNVGRVEISLDGLWHEVCNRGDNLTTDITFTTWNIPSVMVACRQMGYPGAGLAGGGRFGDGSLGRSVDNFRCTGGNIIIFK